MHHILNRFFQSLFFISFTKRTAALFAAVLVAVAVSISGVHVSRAQGMAPTITSFTPSIGPIGTVVTITGTNFTGTTEVRFGTTSAGLFRVDSSTQITSAVPPNAKTGTITVITPNGQAVSTASFTVTDARPTISRFSPISGPPGTRVTITGTNFANVLSVKFNMTEVQRVDYAVDSTTQITARVPAGTTSGPVSVTTADGTAVSTDSFTIAAAAAPTVSKFKPKGGPPGTKVTIRGTNFVNVKKVTFGKAEAQMSRVTVDAGGTRITAFVPGEATEGPVVVEAEGGRAQSSQSFVPDCKVKEVKDTRWVGKYYPNRNLEAPATVVRDDTDQNGFFAFQWKGSPARSCGFPEDNFSVRWERKVFFAAGKYDFKIKADDGVRVYIDSVRILNEWRDQGATLFTVRWDLTGGDHVVTMEMYDHEGDATAEISWALQTASRDGGAPTTIEGDGEFRGALDGSDETTLQRDGSFFADAYRFEGRAGHFVTLELSSLDFPPHLLLIAPNGEFVEAEDVGEPSGTHPARSTRTKTFRLPMNGTYLVEASSLGQNQTGAYILGFRVRKKTMNDER